MIIINDNSMGGLLRLYLTLKLRFAESLRSQLFIIREVCNVMLYVMFITK